MHKSRGCTALAMFHFIPWKQKHRKECSGNTVRAQGTCSVTCHLCPLVLRFRRSCRRRADAASALS